MSNQGGGSRGTSNKPPKARNLKRIKTGLHKISLPLGDPEEGRSIHSPKATQGEALSQDMFKDLDLHHGNTGVSIDGERLTATTTFVPGAATGHF